MQPSYFSLLFSDAGYAWSLLIQADDNLNLGSHSHSNTFSHSDTANTKMPADQFLPAIGHAISGATGTAISTTATYPLDLVNTRLKVQRQLRKDGTISPSEQYAGITDAVSRIYEREGGLKAFYAGLGSDIFKGVADSFLFFLFVSPHCACDI